MLSLNQAITLIIAISLTVMFLLIGYQILVILQQLKRSMDKINHILDQAGEASSAVAQPLVAFSSFVTGLKGGINLLSMFAPSQKNHSSKTSKKKEEE